MGKLKKTYTKMKLLFLILLLGVLYTRALIKLHMMLSQVVQPNLHLLNVICPRTEDADQTLEKPSAQLVTVQNGGGVVHPLFTSQLIKLHMMPSQLVPPRRSSRRSSRRSLLRSQPLQSATFQRTEDADQNTETLSAHLDIVQNGGGAVPQLYTRALTKPNMTPNQLVPPRRPSRRSSRSQRSRSPLRRRLPRNQRLLSRSQRSRSPLKRRLPRSQRSRSPLRRRSPRSQRSRSLLKRRLLPRRLSRRPPRRLSSQRLRSLLKRRLLPRRLSRRLSRRLPLRRS